MTPCPRCETPLLPGAACESCADGDTRRTLARTVQAATLGIWVTWAVATWIFDPFLVVTLYGLVSVGLAARLHRRPAVRALAHARWWHAATVLGGVAVALNGFGTATRWAGILVQ